MAVKYKVLKECVMEGEYYAVGDTYEPNDDMSTAAMANLIEHGFLELAKDEPWSPKVGDEYYYLSGIGYACYEPSFCHDTEDDEKIVIGNCFQTLEQAEQAAKWLKAFKVLRDDTNGFKPAFYREQMFDVYYDYEDKELLVGSVYIEQHGLIYFANETDAEKSIRKHKNEWLTFFGIEEQSE